MRDKRLLLQAAANWVSDGALLGMTNPNLEVSPMGFLRELIRQKKKNLKVMTLPGGGINIDLLIGAGVVTEYETSSCHLGGYGPAPNFQKAVRSREFKLKDNT